MDREKTIIKVSIQGIIVNLILVSFKAVIGLMTNSIAVILDAVNNLSDALSQVITIAGTKLSAKAPDKEHPFGYGRIEYISSVIVAVLVLMAGLTSLKESAVKVIHPEPADYTIVSLIIIAVAVVVKFGFGTYVKKIGESIDSQALIASGTDSSMDSILSLSTLVAAFISKFAGITLEGILGVILSVFIIKAGLEILKETLNSIIGSRADSEFTIALKKQIREYEGVNGAYDLILHDYGPNRSIGTVHIEVDSSMTSDQIHLLSKRIIRDIHKEHGIILTVGIYSHSHDEATVAMRTKIASIVKSFEHILSMHAFFVDFDRKYTSFDVVVSYKEVQPEDLTKAIIEKVKEMYPDFECEIGIDRDFSD